MEIAKAIEQYVERKIDFQKEVIIMHDGTHDNSPYIHTWNITEKTKPSMQDLERVYKAAELTEREREKIKEKKIQLKMRIDAGESEAVNEDMSVEKEELAKLME